MDECIESLREVGIFLASDGNCCYCKAWINKRVSKRTTFTRGHGRYTLKWNSIWLKKVPITLKRATDVMISSVMRQSALVYLDSVVLFMKTGKKNTTTLTYPNTTAGCRCSAQTKNKFTFRSDHSLSWSNRTAWRMRESGISNRRYQATLKTWNGDRNTIALRDCATFYNNSSQCLTGSHAAEQEAEQRLTKVVPIINY